MRFEPTRPAEIGADASADAWAEFHVADAAERMALLVQLRDGRVPLSLTAPTGITVATQLWSLDAAQQRLSFSADADDMQMQQLAQCDDAVAVAYLERIKLQFDLVDLVLVRGAQGVALCARLPERLYRFQRRAGYRVHAPERSAPRAELRHPSLPDMLLALRIVDLSVGGCALLLPDDVPVLQPGASLHGVRVELDGNTAFRVTLRLQHVSAMHGSGLRLGCEFGELDAPAQRSLQRWIDHTQQRRRWLPQR